MCSVCGHKKKELALSDRMYVCECGNRMDRDVNAAVNIREEGKGSIKNVPDGTRKKSVTG
ncbi:MAG: zinc ribbon domain-containing protein [Blautia sp.]